MKKVLDPQQIAFSNILFDTLFGLVLFFSLDSFLEITGATNFIFYLFTLVILIHWWLIFKSADDAFDNEVSDSAADLVFGVIYIIFIEYIILLAKAHNFLAATYFLIALLSVDLAWALIWRYVGKWETSDERRIGAMEGELNQNIKVDIVTILLCVSLVTLSPYLSVAVYVASFIGIYLLYIALTFRYKIIDLKIF